MGEMVGKYDTRVLLSVVAWQGNWPLNVITFVLFLPNPFTEDS